MNNEIKVSLNVVLPGSTMLSQEEAETLENNKPGTGFSNFRLNIRKGVDKTISVRKNKTARQFININMESYNYMISKDAPYFIKTRDWERLSKTKRLEAHLKKICEELGGISYTYIVLDN